MLCTDGTHAVDLWQPLFFVKLCLFEIGAVNLLLLMLCTVGIHAVDLWQPLACC